jgi:diguanylate cyclase (GGDEF)-like protein
MEVEQLFQADETLNSVVVMDKGKPAGLIMRHQLYRVLSAKYGAALHERRPVFMIMDDKCLIVAGDSALEYVAKLAMNRPKLNTYDDIVVAGKGAPPKLVTVRKLIDTLAVAQIELAKGANPLTGLPGNLAIEQEIEARGNRGDSFAIVYGDLDNFKVYNDKYGFKSGDDVIRLISRVMSWAALRHGGPSGYVGHIGGDDFVLLAPRDKVERVCQAITRCFGRTIKQHYNEEDLARGSIQGKDRSGREGEFPLVSVSLAIIEVAGPCDICEVSERAAEMKKYAKSIAGNASVRDRRGPLGVKEKAPACPLSSP